MAQGVLILTGPSGVGKSTISNALVGRLPSAEKVVSFTSRFFSHAVLEGGPTIDNIPGTMRPIPEGRHVGLSP